MTTDDADQCVGGVVLTAGASSRFDDGNQLLASVDGTPLVCRSAATLVAFRLDDVVAVVKHEADVVRDALDGLPVAIRRNEAYTEG